MPREHRRIVAPQSLLEAEVVEGLEKFAVQELRATGRAAKIQMHRAAVTFEAVGSLRSYDNLKSVTAVYMLQGYDVPRPRALLGDAHWRRFMSQIGSVIDRNWFTTFTVAAAGDDSSVMQRIKDQIAFDTGLTLSDDRADLLIRIRKSRDGTGWETLVRLTPRPLSMRSWRVCNFEGALNATVAYAMIQMLLPDASDEWLNLCSGSGTFLIERQQLLQPRHCVGVDIDPSVHKCARDNITQSGIKGVELIRADIRQLPFPDGRFNRLIADLPFGQRVGSHEQNKTLYPQFLVESARVGSSGARMAVITHEIRIFEGALQRSPWVLEHAQRINLRGLHPQVYLMRLS